VVVADGGSDDGTRELAVAAGATVVLAPGSRADAMNEGARAAEGGALLFLHADTSLPPGAGALIRAALASADGGAFAVRLDGRPLPARLAAAAYRPFHRGVYGDQAIFVRRESFERLGGYRAQPIMEDYDLVRRLRAQGRFTLLRESVTTSARRQQAHGEVRTFATVAAIKLLYRLGVSPVRLARLYGRLA
jgi:glycosyltransferase involved in cell wall biosynthesis